MDEFRAETRGSGDAAVIALHGVLDGSADRPLRSAYDDATATGPTVVVLDFAGVQFINSTGIALLVGLLRRATDEDREMRAAGLSAHYRHIFEITRLADFISMHDTPQDAVGAARG